MWSKKHQQGSYWGLGKTEKSQKLPGKPGWWLTVASPAFLSLLSSQYHSIMLLALLLALYLDNIRARIVTRQRIEMGSKVWKGRECCCCVHQALEGRQGSKGEMSILLLSGLHQEAGKCCFLFQLPPCPPQRFLVFILPPQWGVGRWAVKESLVGWEDYVFSHTVQSRCTRFRAKVLQSLAKNGPHLKRVCSLVLPWLFLVFVFCQIREVLKNMFLLRTLLSCVFWATLVQEMLLFGLLLLEQNTFQLPKATRR